MSIEHNPEKEQPLILIKDIWENIPDNYVSIYHHTKSDNLNGISEKGITPFGEKNIKEDEQESSRMEARKIIDQKIDAFAKQSGYDFSRAESFYCSPVPGESGDWHQSDINLEIKISPDEVSVFDADLATGAAITWTRTPEGQKWLADHPKFPNGSNREEFLKKLKDKNYFPDKLEEYAKKYWSSGITLKDFLNLSKEERKNKFQSPEILIPFKVDQKFIRINKPKAKINI